MTGPKKPNGYWTHENTVNDLKTFYRQHGEITQRSFIKHGRTDLSNAVRKLEYEGLHGWPAAYAVLGIKPIVGPAWTKERVISTIKDFFKEHRAISSTLLKQNGFYGLVQAAVHFSYNGKKGMAAAYDAAGITTPRPSTARKWSQELIIRQVKEFHRVHGVVTANRLKEEGMSGLLSAISNNFVYDGKTGMAAVCALLEINPHTNAGKTRSRRTTQCNVDDIKKEIQNFYDTHGTLSNAALRQHGTQGLGCAITRHFVHEGLRGMRAAKAYLGIASTTSWDHDLIVKELRGFYEEHGVVTRAEMTSQNRGDLVAAIEKHLRHDGLTGFAAANNILGLEVRRAQWTSTQVIDECRTFYERHGDITQKMLVENERNDIVVAITRHLDYNGLYGWPAVYCALNIKPARQVQKKKWFPLVIFNEALNVLEEYGDVSTAQLYALGLKGLVKAAERLKYKEYTGMRALRALLKVSKGGPDLEGMLDDIVGGDE